MSEAETELLKYERFDLDRYTGKQEAGGGVQIEISGGNQPAPIAKSWLAWHVKFPTRLALLTLVCILIYEILVGVSVGVRRLRWVMVNWLMWLLLGINIALLLTLAGIVVMAKTDWSFLKYGWKL